MIRVLLVDDQEIIVKGMEVLLNNDDNIQIVNTASNGLEAIKICENNGIDVVVMDIRMPIMDGVEATKKIKEMNDKIKILVLTTFNDDAFIFSSLKNGASGYLLKDASPDEIVNAVKTVYEGGTLINPKVATKVVNRLKNNQVMRNRDVRVELLTKREKDICHYLVEGMNNAEIAAEICVSEGTIKNNMTKILDKLELRDRTQLALFAVKNDL